MILEVIPREIAINRIQQIPQYTYASSIEMITVEVDKLKPLCLFVRNYRLKPASDLINAYTKQDIPLFEPVKTGVRIINPPIIELHDNMFVIIDGLHRINYLRQIQVKSAIVMIVYGVNVPLPADILNWDEVQHTNEKLSRKEKFRNLKVEYFRPIDWIVDKNSKY